LKKNDYNKIFISTENIKGFPEKDDYTEWNLSTLTQKQEYFVKRISPSLNDD
jgi:hypothetical protein